MPTDPAPAAAAASKEKGPPEIKTYFDLVSEGTHTVAEGKNRGKVLKATHWACKSLGCPRGHAKPIKLVASDTGALFTHLDTCNPQLARRLRVPFTR